MADAALSGNAMADAADVDPSKFSKMADRPVDFNHHRDPSLELTEFSLKRCGKVSIALDSHSQVG
ncbi:MAG: hypothetical protein AAFN06_15610 [Pseudomonadota bacterium]